jgi:hypothetical protein
MVCVIALVVAPAPLRADGIAIIGGSPRAIGRAGAATVGDDGGGALLVNPAAMARRETWRVQLGTAAIEDTVQWQSNTEASALSNSRAGTRLAPIGAAIGGLDGWVLGAGVMTAGVVDRSLPRPSDAHGDLGSTYDYRYTGIAGGYRRDTVMIGAARRIHESLAFGLSAGAARIQVNEQRRVWAGVGGRDTIGSPTSDVELQLSGSDDFALSAVAGVMYAPVDTQIELGASVAWAETVHLDGDAVAVGVPGGPTVRYVAPPRDALDVTQPLTVRAGGRYVGDRVVAELDGDLWLAADGAEATAWQVRGIRVLDSSPLYVDLRGLPSRISQHTHVAMRTAVDVALIPGFLWATAGYAYSTLGTPADRLSPTFADLGGHTLGLGLEGTSGGVTVTLGWSRTWSLATQAPTVLQLDNPFGAGDGPVPLGTYDGSIDQIGVLLEVELGGPRAP